MNLTSRLVATLHHLRNRATTENFVPAPPVSPTQKNDTGSTPSPIRWLGADVIISEQPVHGNVSNHCDAIVVTQHARALAWLYTFLRYESGNALNYLNESEFYAETSRAVNDLLRRNPNASQSEVLIAALDGALEIVQEWLDRGIHHEKPSAGAFS